MIPFLDDSQIKSYKFLFPTSEVHLRWKLIELPPNVDLARATTHRYQHPLYRLQSQSTSQYLRQLLHAWWHKPATAVWPDNVRSQLQRRSRLHRVFRLTIRAGLRPNDCLRWHTSRLYWKDWLINAASVFSVCYQFYHEHSSVSDMSVYLKSDLKAWPIHAPTDGLLRPRLTYRLRTSLPGKVSALRQPQINFRYCLCYVSAET